MRKWLLKDNTRSCQLAFHAQRQLAIYSIPPHPPPRYGENSTCHLCGTSELGIQNPYLTPKIKLARMVQNQGLTAIPCKEYATSTTCTVCTNSVLALEWYMDNSPAIQNVILSHCITPPLYCRGGKWWKYLCSDPWHVQRVFAQINRCQWNECLGFAMLECSVVNIKHCCLFL